MFRVTQIHERSIPGYLLAVCCPVPDVLLLLFHTVLHPRSAGRRHAAAAWTRRAVEPRAAVRDQVMRPYVGASTVLRGIPAGAELFL